MEPDDLNEFRAPPPSRGISTNAAVRRRPVAPADAALHSVPQPKSKGRQRVLETMSTLSSSLAMVDDMVGVKGAVEQFLVSRSAESLLMGMRELSAWHGNLLG